MRLVSSGHITRLSIVVEALLGLMKGKTLNIVYNLCFEGSLKQENITDILNT